jgi:DNA-binding response OmpR family regulator
MAKILLFEGDSMQSLLMAWSLRQSGFEVQSINNAVVFWEYLEFFCPDLVLMELVLPDVDGFDLLEALEKRKPHPPIIILSTRFSSNVIERALGLGVSRYLTKPQDPDTIVCAISEALAE